MVIRWPKHVGGFMKFWHFDVWICFRILSLITKDTSASSWLFDFVHHDLFNSVNNKILKLHYPFIFNSDISPLIIIFWKLLTFIGDHFINERFNLGVHAILNIDDNFASVHSDISKLSFWFMSHNNCSHKYLLPNITHTWRTTKKKLGKEISGY